MTNKQEKQPKFYCSYCGAKLTVIGERVAPCKSCSNWSLILCRLYYMRGYSAGFAAGTQVMDEKFGSKLADLEFELDVLCNEIYGEKNKI